MCKTIWLLSASRANSSLQLCASLAGHRISQYDGVGNLKEWMSARCEAPDALVAHVNSIDADGRATIHQLQPYFNRWPSIAVDESFDAEFGKHLITLGVQEYMKAADATSEQIRWRIDLAVLRKDRHPPHRVPPEPASLRKESSHAHLSSVLTCLPPRQRQVLDLLVDGHSPKRIAAKLGTKQQTVRNQIATLRDKLGVESPQQLVIVTLRTRFNEANGNG